MNVATHNSIDAVAFDWVVRSSDGLGAAEQAALDDWIAADDRHLGAYVRAQAVQVHADRTRALGPAFDPDDFLTDGPAQPSERAGDHTGYRPSRLTRRLFMAAAATSAVATGASFFLLRGEQAYAATFRSGVGEIRSVSLPDGSAIRMNTDSEVQLLFGRSNRAVTLVSGEVLFDAAFEQDRPVIVSAKGITLTAPAGRFLIENIRDRPYRVVMLVGDASIADSDGDSMRLGPNMQALLPRAGRPELSTLEPADIDDALLWQQRKLAFREVPLSDALAQFGRYGGTPVRADDPAILRLKISGVFASDDPAGFARTVEEAFNLAVRQENDGLKLIPR